MADNKNDAVSNMELNDILPDEHIYYTFIKKVVRHRCRQSGYRRMTPILMDKAETFHTSLGATSPLGKDALFTFEKDGETVAMRPELTTGMSRAYTVHDMHKLPQPVELYAIEPVFQVEKDESGKTKTRQFLQFGVEIIGEEDAAMDAQVIYLARKILKDLGISDRIELKINNLGGEKVLNAFKEELKNFYYGKEHVLGEEGKALLNSNPIRLLTSEDEDLKILAQLAPKLSDFVENEKETYFKDVREYLDELGIEYEVDNLVLGDVDYYTHCVFNFVDKETGKVILSGGRYADLIEKMGGVSTPAVGFLSNFEDIVEVMKHEDIYIKDKDTVDVFVAQLGVEAKKKCMSSMMKLRESGVHAIGALGKGSMKEQLALAEKFNASWTILMGQIEVLEGIAIIRNMAAGSQEIVRYEDLVNEILERVGYEELDQYTVGVEETVYQGSEDNVILGEEYEDMMEEDEE